MNYLKRPLMCKIFKNFLHQNKLYHCTFHEPVPWYLTSVHLSSWFAKGGYVYPSWGPWRQCFLPCPPSTCPHSITSSSSAANPSGIYMSQLTLVRLLDGLRCPISWMQSEAHALRVPGSEQPEGKNFQASFLLTRPPTFVFGEGMIIC